MKRKGFTLIEMVTTLAILGISTTMTAVVIANLSNSQSASSDQYNYSEQIDHTRELVSKFATFVSLNTSGEDGISFTYKSLSEDHKSLTFTDGVGDFTMEFLEKTLRVKNNNGRDIPYLNYTDSVYLPDVTNFVINYEEDLAMIKVTFDVNAKEYRVVSVVRTQL